MRFANYRDAVRPAYAFPPCDGDVRAGDAFFGGAGRLPSGTGDYDYLTMLHEVGHMLGLKHGHDRRGGYGAVPGRL